MALIGPQVELGGTTEWIYTQLQAGVADHIHIDDVFQILDVRQNEILLVCRASLDRCSKRNALDAGSIA